MISDGWLMIILKHTVYYPIYWGWWSILGIQFFADHYQWDIAWFQKLRVTLPCGESTDSLFAGDIPDFWCMEKSGFWSKEIFFFHILQVQSWRISRIQVFPDLPKTLQRVDGRILVFPDVLTVNSTYFLSQLPGSERTWAQWDAENHHFNWWQINYWIDWTFITFYSWFIAIMYSYSNLKCLQHSITNY